MIITMGYGIETYKLLGEIDINCAVDTIEVEVAVDDLEVEITVE